MAASTKLAKISGQPFVTVRYSMSSDRQIFSGMSYNMVGFSQVGPVMKSRDIATSKTSKKRIAINIDSSMCPKVVY
jgi:hypothetical protein